MYVLSTLRSIALTIFSQNVFWKIANSDPHAALSFDRLHTFPGGLFRHIWDRVKPLVEEDLTREERAGIDEMYVIPYVLSQPMTRDSQRSALVLVY